MVPACGRHNPPFTAKGKKMLTDPAFIKPLVGAVLQYTVGSRHRQLKCFQDKERFEKNKIPYFLFHRISSLAEKSGFLYPGMAGEKNVKESTPQIAV